MYRPLIKKSTDPWRCVAGVYGVRGLDCADGRRFFTSWTKSAFLSRLCVDGTTRKMYVNCYSTELSYSTIASPDVAEDNIRPQSLTPLMARDFVDTIPQVSRYFDDAEVKETGLGRMHPSPESQLEYPDDAMTWSLAQ
jgi:hypothetical protein